MDPASHYVCVREACYGPTATPEMHYGMLVSRPESAGTVNEWMRTSSFPTVRHAHNDDASEREQIMTRKL